VASPRELRRRIKSISGTAQITRAMQMVAASKMRKAQEAAIAAAPFARRIYRMQRSATTRTIDFQHPLLEVREVPRDAPQTVLALVLRTSHHWAVHTGQIVYATKHLTQGGLDELWMKTML